MKVFCLVGLSLVLLLIMLVMVKSSQEGIGNVEMKYLEEGEQFVGRVLFVSVARSRMDCNVRYIQDMA